MQISPDSSSSFRVMWSELPVSERNGKITNYKVEYGKEDASMTLNVHLPYTSREYIVTGEMVSDNAL